MSKTMLIDAAHAEEVRVVVLDGPRVEEYDFETKSRKQLRGNVYLAKVTRVEPSLQAAFVEYGGNRQGFLAFNEIHPDYFQIPVSDREALMRELAAEEDDPSESDDDADPDDDSELSAEDARLRRKLMRRYKIQEVIKRRQILLIQVVKEERGSKGAALTTYLSLAGRYCVLMPNSARGGGISRKITNAADRKRLKAVATSLEVPNGMGLIVRTAGAARTKQEIKRDYEYLLRMWESIRETTMASIAPALIYAEEDLIKRSIRDLFDKDFDAVYVEGEEGYREAKDFMRMLVPTQAKKVQHYKDRIPLFARYRVEEPLAQIHTPIVPLKSGGYIVINQTEALVAIDVNSGKSTKERNIEATAMRTNLEAAEEACRQMRLRDLAGLIVIDFIDMEESKNDRAVEKKLKDCLKDDRARVQMGKISPFGLMEISRQRRRTGVLEGTTEICPHCQGLGRVRSVESMSLAVLRAVEYDLMRFGPGAIVVRAPIAIALYILNEKRPYLERLKIENGFTVVISADPLVPHGEFEIDRTLADPDFKAPPLEPLRALIDSDDPSDDEFEDDEEDEDEDEDVAVTEDDAAPETDDADISSSDDPSADAASSGRGRLRRRRRRRDGRPETEAPKPQEPREPRPAVIAEDLEGEDSESANRRRRRGRRGGRRMRDDFQPRDVYTWLRARTPSLEAPYVWIDPFARNEAPRAFEAPVVSENEDDLDTSEAPVVIADTGIDVDVPASAVEIPVVTAAETIDTAVEAPKKPRRSRAKKKPEAAPSSDEAAVPPAADPAPNEEPVVLAPEPVLAVVEPAPVPTRVLATAELVTAEAEADPAEISQPPAKPKRGWWGKLRGG